MDEKRTLIDRERGGPAAAILRKGRVAKSAA